jgi:alginate O-acetyltransferase complex protein AlgI
MSYWFAYFVAAALPIYWLTWNGTARRLILLSCCIIFHTHFAGPAGVIPIVALGTITYFAGLVRWKSVILLAIALNASALILNILSFSAMD